jgi:hypothetical protein
MFGTRVPLMADLRNGVGLAAVVTAGVVAVAGCSSPSKAPAGSPATSAPTSGAPTSSPAAAPPTSTALDLRESGGGSAEEQAHRPGLDCQRVLSAVRNAVIDVKACAFKISDLGVQTADKIAAEATQ